MTEPMQLGARTLGSPARPASTEGGETLNYDLRLATPMYGGGTAAGKIDQKQPIRATEIRGVLRQWWRVCAAHRFTSDGITDWQALRQRETEIWGSTEFPSPVAVSVTWNRSQKLRCESLEQLGVEQGNPKGYALFSALAADRDNPGVKLLSSGFQFTVAADLPSAGRLVSMRRAENEQRRRDGKEPLPALVESLAGEVRDAMQAWAAFGGIGSRTRRGVGSIELLSTGCDFPMLVPQGCRLLVHPEQHGAAEDAWETAIKSYRDFRQKRNKGSKSGSTNTGRSWWPEPEAIRELTGCRDPRHDRLAPTPTVPSFPRAVLGMPIEFTFFGRKNKQAEASQDPVSTDLLPVVGGTAMNRMASPIITKAVKIEGKWRPACLFLPYGDALEVMVQLGPSGRSAPFQKTDTAGNGKRPIPIPNSQVRGPSIPGLFPADKDPMFGQEDAIAALHKFLATRGFEEIG